MAEIELINVSKSWGDFKAVIDFNLTIKNKKLTISLKSQVTKLLFENKKVIGV